MTGKRVIVCGGRDYDEQDHVWDTLDRLDRTIGPFDVIIHGGAFGADEAGKMWSDRNARRHLPFAADWRAHGLSAGPKRNQQMIDDGRPDLVIAFPGGRGTADMVRRARKAGLIPIEIKGRQYDD